MTQTPWDLLLAGDQERAFHQLRYEHPLEGSASHIMELGVAYLWVRDYQAAWEHFDSASQSYPRQMDILYEMAGAARWCLGDPAGAVQQWRVGLGCQYTDGAGGVSSPLLLSFASLVQPEVFDGAQAESLLAVRAMTPLAVNWPGAVAQFVAGMIDLETLRKRCIGRDESDTMLFNWLADFYVGVLEHARGNMEQFKELMRRTATTTDDDFDITKGQYLCKLWHAEFFLARHEAER